MRFAIPIVVLVGLLALLGYGLRLDPRVVPSPLIGKPAPAFDLPNLQGSARVTPLDLRGRPVLVNFFASWCAGCQVEHPVLMQLAHEYGVEIVGMDYKDTQEAAQQWLDRHGLPYRSVIADQQGTAGLDWGVYGVPETFVLGADGRILYKQIGPMTLEAWREHIAPLMTAGRAS
ncbi:MAG: DsbE family thiol:disulfide interchange protein [Hydrocarboniphaga sp.]|uniref:DsbE family thiol:disulfide interchange protein n=1 Tax=Hydrocarboniphaga sp. TaxID=2033016 RepID=UPI00261E6846|nr:DsbE family thiol:disulfide interchange protein [Hydrocarboniphaga sp.]MDB5971095.1 DsbE family thiol:disulfide interchange protein [Hydrocarboniphaga sp.]